MTLKEILELATATRLREVTGDTPWIIFTAAAVPAALPSLSGLTSPLFADTCHATAALVSSFGFIALMAGLLKYLSSVDCVPKILAGAFLGLLAGLLGALLGFARHATNDDFIYRLAVTAGLSALEAIGWNIALDLASRRMVAREERLAVAAVFIMVQIAAAGAVAYLVSSGVDRFEPGITFFEICLISGAFVVLRAMSDLLDTDQVLRAVLMRSMLLLALVGFCLVVFAPTGLAHKVVYEDDQYPITTFAGMIVAAVVWASTCYWAAPPLAEWTHRMMRNRGA